MNKAASTINHDTVVSESSKVFRRASESQEYILRLSTKLKQTVSEYFIGRRAMRKLQPFCCCTAFLRRRSCSASSSLVSPIITVSSLRICPVLYFTEVPRERKYAYSFDGLASTIEAFTEALNIDRYAIDVFDYGAPTGLRLAMAHPHRVTAVISQNGNAYEEGLSSGCNPIQKYWKEPTAQNRAALRDFLTPEAPKWQYTRRERSRKYSA